MPAEPSRKPRSADTNAGAVRYAAVPRPGTYRITLSAGAWIDVIQDGQTLKSGTFSGRYWLRRHPQEREVRPVGCAVRDRDQRRESQGDRHRGDAGLTAVRAEPGTARAQVDFLSSHLSMSAAIRSHVSAMCSIMILCSGLVARFANSRHSAALSRQTSTAASAHCRTSTLPQYAPVSETALASGQHDPGSNPTHHPDRGKTCRPLSSSGSGSTRRTAFTASSP